jgi:hypothetical protein
MCCSATSRDGQSDASGDAFNAAIALVLAVIYRPLMIECDPVPAHLSRRRAGASGVPGWSINPSTAFTRSARCWASDYYPARGLRGSVARYAGMICTAVASAIVSLRGWCCRSRPASLRAYDYPGWRPGLSGIAPVRNVRGLVSRCFGRHLEA